MGTNTSTEGLEEFTSQIHQAAQESEILEFEKNYDIDHQEMKETSPESDGKESSSISNISDTEGIIQDRQDVRPESVDLTETSPERKAKNPPISNDKEILEKVVDHSDSPDQEKNMQAVGSTDIWKAAALLVILIAGCFLYFQRRH